MRCFLLPVSLTAFAVLAANPSWGQVTPDGTLNTTVSAVGNTFTITNGTTRGSNLFHSFQQFGIPTGGSATFNLVNTPTITTLFSRVTGGNVSNIDGLIRTTNSTNPVSLFLINPSGIIFGPNASLNIGGSFVGTSANSIKFADGTEFSATNPSGSPVLTISVPIGLQMGANPGAIAVQGVGHSLTTQDLIFSPYLSLQPPTGLQVRPGQTLALVGGDLNLNGGVLTAAQGRIELGSVAAGQVSLNVTPQGLTLDYSTVSTLQNIQLTQRSLLNVSGVSAGSIQVQGNRVLVQDGSTLWSQNRGLLPGGAISIRAAQELDLVGTAPDERIRSGIVSETVGPGASSPITINTGRLLLQNAGTITSRTFGPAPSGSITVNATESVQMRGLSPRTRVYNLLGSITFFSSSAATPLPVAKAGNVTITTPSLTMQDGSYLAGMSFGDSRGADIVLNTEAIALSGGVVKSPTGDLATSISSVSYRRGNSGSIKINTRTLTVRNGGLISATSLGTSNAGSVTVNASESVQVAGIMPVTGFFSNISSTVGSGFANIQAIPFYRAIGNAGDVTINTPDLTLSQASVTVQNYGTGDAGTLSVNADAIRLSDRATLTAATKSGDGGNIRLQANTLILRRGSSVTATAGGTGNGGNLTIVGSLIVGAENSDLIANAVRGNGGNIQITSQGIFGLQFRPQLTSENDITASSQFGVNGTVTITDPAIDPTSGLFILPLNLVDSSRQIATECESSQGGSFIVTGRGGVPDDPTQLLRSDRTWADTRDPSAFRTPRPAVPTPLPPVSSAIVEASTLSHINGQLELVAANERNLSMQTATCARAIVPAL